MAKKRWIKLIEAGDTKGRGAARILRDAINYHGTIEEAAKEEFGVSRQTLHRWMKDVGVKVKMTHKVIVNAYTEEDN